jgi:hypothetical protein
MTARIAFLQALDDSLDPEYDLMVLATAAQKGARDATGTLDVDIANKYSAHPSVLVIVHNPTGWLAKRVPDLLKQPSVWVANNARKVCSLALCTRPSSLHWHSSLVCFASRTLIVELFLPLFPLYRFLLCSHHSYCLTQLTLVSPHSVARVVDNTGACSYKAALFAHRAPRAIR